MSGRDLVGWAVVAVAVVGWVVVLDEELGTPPATLVALATTITPLRAAIITEPEAPAR